MLLQTPLGEWLGGPKRHLSRALKVCGVILLVVAVILDAPLVAMLSGLTICAVSFWPGILWCRGRAPGLPIFPLFAATHSWAFGLPLITGHPSVLNYSDESIIRGAVTVCLFLLVATWVWLRAAEKPSPQRVLLRTINLRAGPVLLWLPAIGMALFNIADASGRADALGSFYSLVRGALLGLNTLSVFVLSLRWGRSELTPRSQFFLSLLLCIQMAASASGLLLIGAMTVFMTATLAFAAGRERVPWTALCIGVAIFTFLHVGKATMRERYWTGAPHKIALFEMPSFYGEWLATSAEYLGESRGRARAALSTGVTQPLWWRSSTMQLLLLAQARTPKSVPFMEGATYALIPDLIVPRIFNPKKIRTHEGTHMLNIHFGLQRYEDTFTTTIGWGLLNEAWANFGAWGAAALAVLIGWCQGWVTRFSAAGNLLSLRAMFAILVLSYAFQTEYSAGVLVSALFQSTAALVVLAYAVMRQEWIERRSSVS